MGGRLKGLVLACMVLALAGCVSGLSCTAGLEQNSTPVVSGAAAGLESAVAADAPALGADTRLTRLANGLTVLIKVDRRFPVVSTRLYVHAGSAYEKPEWAGISHLLEHMVFKGTERRPKGGISREIEAAGGYLNAATSFDYTVYITDVPARHWKLGLDVAGDMAFHAALDAGELAAEKEVVIAELKRGKDNPQSELFQAMQASVLAGTPYSHPIIGFEDRLRAIIADDIRAYVRALYQPRNMLLTVVGDVDAGAVLAEAERLFGGYANSGPLELVQPLDAGALGGGAVVSVRPGPWNKVYFGLAVPVPGSGDTQSVTLDMLAELLGGGPTALLPRRYQYERRLVDSIGVSNMSFERVGLLMISARLDADRLPAFWQTLTADLARLKAADFTERELARVRLNAEEGLLRARETVSGLASHLGYFQFFLGGEQGEINLLETLRAVDRPALQRAVDTWLKPARFSAVLLTPRGAAVDAGAMRAALGGGAAAGQGAAAQAVSAGATEIVDLGQGRTVVLIPDATMPHFALELAFSGGEALLSPRQQGLSALAARTLTCGTQQRSRAQLEAFVADRAGAVGASSGRTSFALNLTGPARFSADLLDLFAEIVNRPSFAGPEVTREKALQIAAIRAAEDSPLGLIFRHLPPFLFPDSVFGYLRLGTPEGIEGFARENIRGFWDNQKRRPWVLSVVGTFDREALLAFARRLPVPAQARVDVPAPAWGKERTLALTLAERKQAHLLLVFRTAPQSSPDTPALDLLEEALGGMGGPLFGKLRDEMGLGYTVSVFNVQNDDLGYMAFYIGTDPARLAEARAGFRQVIGDLRKTPLPAAELTRGLNAWEGEYYRGLQSLGSRAGEAAGLTLDGKRLDANRTRIERARALTPEALRAVAQKYLDFDQVYTVTVLPR